MTNVLQPINSLFIMLSRGDCMRLKKLVAETGVSQQKLADYLGVTLQSVNYYINGKREPNIATLIKLAEYFDVSVDYLVGRDVPEEKPMPEKAFMSAGGKTIELNPDTPVQFRLGDQVFELILAEEK